MAGFKQIFKAVGNENMKQDSKITGIQGFEYEVTLMKLPEEYRAQAEHIIEEFFKKINILDAVPIQNQADVMRIVEGEKMYMAMGFKFGVDWARGIDGNVKLQDN